MKIKQILQYVALIGGAIALVAAALAVLLQYDNGTNYFQHGAILPVVAVVAALIATVAATVFACMAKCDRATAQIFANDQKAASLFTAAGFALAALLLVAASAKSGFSGIAILSLLASLGAAAYALATASPALRSQTNAISLLGFLAPIACILFNAYYYFDTAIEMNAPVKTATQLGLLCAMLYFLSELRFVMGQPLPRLFLATAGWVRALGALSAIAVPIAYLTGKCDRLDYVAGAVLTLCVIVSAGLRTKILSKQVRE